jgi:phage gpG-like protein
MMTISEFAAILERSIAEMRPALAVGLDRVGSLAETLAVSYIGEEMPSWPPLAESTIRDKERKGYRVPAPLLRTGQMRDSIQREVDPIDLSVVVGSAEKIALYQEMGTSRIPPRPFLSLGLQNALPFARDVFGDLAVLLLRGIKP